MKCRHALRLLRPAEPWTAVVRGAVLCGATKSPIPNRTLSRVCRRSYGIIPTDSVFSAIIQVDHSVRNSSKPTSLIGSRWERMEWLLTKGDCVFSYKPHISKLRVKVGSSPRSHSGEIVIYAYDEDEDSGVAIMPWVQILYRKLFFYGVSSVLLTVYRSAGSCNTRV